MAEIKSALELALEKAERFGKASPRRNAGDQVAGTGPPIGGRIFREKIDLEPELKKFPPEAQSALAKHVKGILLRNINLPRGGVVDDANKQAEWGIYRLPQG